MEDGNNGSNDTYIWCAMGTLTVGVCLPDRTGDTHIDVPVQALVHFCAQSGRERRAVIMEGDSGKRNPKIHMLNE